MREYNLFIIKKDLLKVYKNDGKFLFDNLKKLFYLNYNYNFGQYLFEQLCQNINVNVVINYFENKFNLKYNDLFIYKGCRIYIKYSRIIIKSKYNLPEILKIFNIYSKDIFVCDFKNNDYFFLNELNHVFLKTL